VHAILQNFIGTTDEWESENPLLYDAAWAIEKTPDGKRLLKIGDGVHYWNDLDYVDSGYLKGLDERLASIELYGVHLLHAVEKETRERMEADDAIKRSLGEEAEARVELQQLVITLTEFIKEQHGPVADIELVSQDLFYIVSQDNRVIISEHNLNF
jgi:hypothetical protein